jgi:hypothetical protein
MNPHPVAEVHEGATTVSWSAKGDTGLSIDRVRCTRKTGRCLASRWISPAVQTIHYSLGYLIALIITPFLLVGGRLIQWTPWRGYSNVLRVF